MILSKLSSSLVLISQLSVVGCSGDKGSSGAPVGEGGSSVDQGKVVLLSSKYQGSFHPGRVYATFTRGVDSPNCVVTQSGDCSVSNCGLSPAMVAWPDAGTIALTSQRAGMNVQLERGAAGAYNQTPLETELSEGDEVEILSAGGADIPSFQASMTFPPTLTMTSAESQSVSEDVTFTWTGGSSNVSVIVQPVSVGGLLCSVPTEKHSLTVPKGLVEAGESIFVAALSSQSVTAGSYSIVASLLTGVLNSAQTGEYKPILTE